MDNYVTADLRAVAAVAAEVGGTALARRREACHGSESSVLFFDESGTIASVGHDLTL